MNKFYTLALLLVFYNTSAQKHELSFNNLLEGSTMPTAALITFLKHKGFKPINGSDFSAGLAFSRSNKNKAVRQIINRKEKADIVFTSFQTTSKQELLRWQQELVQNGFSTYKEKSAAASNSIAAFQQGNIIARIQQLQDSVTTWYSLMLENKKLPTAAAIQYAEDLLQLNSHEYLSAVFGTGNVKKDQFYFSEKETNKCSVLFPNTSNQVIFVWNDEENNKDISFLILGGLANKQNQLAIFSGNQFHKWRSRQGIYLGMPLRELHALNGRSIEFYDWNTDQPGFVLAKSEGRINLKGLGIQLQCLECNEKESKPSQPVLTSETVLHGNDRVLVNSLIILPDRETNAKQ